jgi:hypothetical protein
MLSLFWQAAEEVAPDAVTRQRELNPILRFAAPHDLEVLWRNSGLCDVETVTLKTSMHFSSFEDYWRPFLGRSTPTSAFAASIDNQTDGALVTALRRKIPSVRPDGSFALTACAWAVKGSHPEQSTM